MMAAFRPTQGSREGIIVPLASAGGTEPRATEPRELLEQRVLQLVAQMLLDPRHDL